MRRDTREKMQSAMEQYLSTYGWHFNKKLEEYAVSMMKDKSGSKIQPYTKEKVETMLKDNSIDIPASIIYDAIYVTNMARADYMGSSIITEQQLAKFVGDYLNDKDGYDGVALTRFYADTIGKGCPIYWEDVL